MHATRPRARHESLRESLPYSTRSARFLCVTVCARTETHEGVDESTGVESVYICRRREEGAMG